MPIDSHFGPNGVAISQAQTLGGLTAQQQSINRTGTGCSAGRELLRDAGVADVHSWLVTFQWMKLVEVWIVEQGAFAEEGRSPTMRPALATRAESCSPIASLTALAPASSLVGHDIHRLHEGLGGRTWVSKLLWKSGLLGR